MFPRRRTDQVYATLQQVQRRITEQSGGPSSVSTPAGMSAPAGRTPAVGSLTPGPQPAIRSTPQVPAPSDTPPLPPLLPPGHAAHQRYAVVLSGTLVSLLLVCWLASLAVAILVGQRMGRVPGALPGEPAQRPAMTASRAEEAPRFKLVVCSDTRATPDVRREYAKDRDRLNEIMRKNEKLGWQPWFQVEEGVNGAVMLVFAPQGVDKAQWADFFQKLTRSRQYAEARWVEVR